MDFKSILDAAVSSARFKIGACIEFEGYLEPTQRHECNVIKQKLTAKEFKAFKRSIIRNSFLIELVNDKVTSTKVETHWSRRLDDDVRYSSYETCVEIFKKLLNKIANYQPKISVC